MRKFKRKRGFLTFAQNGEHDYVRMAYVLALSLKVSQIETPYLAVAVTPGTNIPDRYRWAFDEIVDITWGDAAQHSSWKLENEWKAYHITPYQETYKLDADMLFGNDISSWWNHRSHDDIMLGARATTFRDDAISYGRYRRGFSAVGLPDVYSCMMRFRWSDESEKFFEYIEEITNDWQAYYASMLLPEARPDCFSTDMAVALALRLMQRETTWGKASPQYGPRFVHMRSDLQNFSVDRPSQKWRDHIDLTVSTSGQIKLGRYLQKAPVHYIDKDTITDELIAHYEKIVK